TTVEAALDRVAARVTRLGHSTSLVSMKVVSGDIDVAGRMQWIPSEQGTEFLRVPIEGQLARLERAHEQHQQVEQRILPADHVRYKRVGSEPRQTSRWDSASSSFADSEQDWIIFET